jgi:hypothetical protein
MHSNNKYLTFCAPFAGKSGTKATSTHCNRILQYIIIILIIIIIIIIIWPLVC